MWRVLRILRDPRTLLGCRVFLGLFFIRLALAHMASVEDFALVVKNYRALPYWAIQVFALILPWTELMTGLFFLVGLWPRSAALIAACILLAFVVARNAALARGLNPYCGCMSGAPVDLPDRIIKDLVMIWISVHVLRHGPGYGLEKDAGAPSE